MNVLLFAIDVVQLKRINDVYGYEDEEESPFIAKKKRPRSQKKRRPAKSDVCLRHQVIRWVLQIHQRSHDLPFWLAQNKRSPALLQSNLILPCGATYACTMHPSIEP